MSNRLSLCLMCGERGLSDIILNVVLFLPLGGLIAHHTGARLRSALLVGFLFSFAIEAAQLVAISGRHPSVGDLVFNSLGAVIGSWFVGGGWNLWFSSQQNRRAFLGLALASVLGVWAVTGFLGRSDFPENEWVGQWTPRLGHLSPYEGEVLAALIEGLPLEVGAVSNDVRASIQSGLSLDLSFLAGPPTRRLSSIVSVYDVDQNQVVLVGVRGVDVVVQQRTKADDWFLNSMEARWRGASAAWVPGERVELRLRTDPSTGAVCLALKATLECRRGPTVDDGWGYLIHPSWVSGWLAALVGLGWMICLAGVPGSLIRGFGEAWVSAATLFLGLGLIPSVVSLEMSGVVAYLGTLCGLLGGWGTRRVIGWLLRMDPNRA